MQPFRNITNFEFFVPRVNLRQMDTESIFFEQQVFVKVWLSMTVGIKLVSHANAPTTYQDSDIKGIG